MFEDIYGPENLQKFEIFSNIDKTIKNLVATQSRVYRLKKGEGEKNNLLKLIGSDLEITGRNLKNLREFAQKNDLGFLENKKQTYLKLQKKAKRLEEDLENIREGKTRIAGDNVKELYDKYRIFEFWNVDKIFLYLNSKYYEENNKIITAMDSKKLKVEDFIAIKMQIERYQKMAFIYTKLADSLELFPIMNTALETHNRLGALLIQSKEALTSLRFMSHDLYSAKALDYFVNKHVSEVSHITDLK